MTATWACTEALIEDLKQSEIIAAARVTDVPPSEQQQDKEYVFANGTEGAFEDGPSASGPLIEDEVFTVALIVMVGKRGTAQLAMRRLAEIIGQIRKRVAANQTLVSLETDDWSVTEVRLRDVKTTPFQSTDPYASAELGVEFEVRHYGGNR